MGRSASGSSFSSISGATSGSRISVSSSGHSEISSSYWSLTVGFLDLKGRPLPGEPYGDPALLEILLDFLDSVILVMDHGGNEGRVGPALGQDCIEMLRGAGPAGGDDRDGHGLGNHPGQGQLISGLGAVGIDGIEANLPGAQAFAFLGPPQGVQARGGAAPMAHHLV